MKIMAICCLIAACAVIQPIFTTFAAEAAQSKTIKAAVLNNTTYADRDEKGNWRGLDVECLISIAQKTGFNLEFIDSSNDPDFLGSLNSGVYDIVADVVKTPEREKQYLFTDTPIGYTNSTLAVRADDDRWDYGNIEQVSRMKIGVRSSYANNEDFRKWCVQHAVTPVIKEYKDIEQMTKALIAGEIDGEVYTAVYSKEDAAKLRPIMRFLPESFYYAFRKSDIVLKNKVDDALSQILAGNADYLTSLKNKYEEQYNINELPFSLAEKRYIREHPVLTVAVAAADMPYYERDAEGRDKGILPDYYALAASGCGFRFQYKVCRSQREAIAAVKNGSADIVGVFSGGIVAAYQHGLTLTDSFSTVTNILLTKSGTDISRIRSIAVSGQEVKDYLAQTTNRTFPKARINEYENAQECLRAVDSGAAAAALIELPSATWLVNQINSTAYSIFPVTGMVSSLCGAVRSDSWLLCSILNKRFAATKDSFIGIAAKDTLPRSDWKTVISRLPPFWSILAVGILLALVLVLTWALLLLRRRQRERAAVLAAQADTEKQKLQVEAIQKSAEDRNQFFANISHDMRTPLNAITNFILLAQKDDLPPQQRKAYLGKAEASSKLLLELINDTLTVSKLSSGKLYLQPQPCRAAELLEAVAVPVREAAENKKINFQVDISKVRDQMVYADVLNIKKIFLNLLTNAIRYTPAGGHIWYSALQEPDDGEFLNCLVTVRDDGIGISDAFLPHLFEPFAQEKRSGYESVGTGLGLSIVKQLTTLMGGSIEVKSKVGEGTAFAVRLHLKRAPDAAVPPEPKISAADFTSLAGSKILLCEDNELNREIAVALIRDKGLEAVSAANGKLGLEVFAASAENEFAAILMDVRMPVMDGLEAAREIRNLSRPDAKTVPIIAMTADAFADDVQKCLAAGMNAHVAKPIDPEQFYQTLLKTMRQ